MKNARFAQSRYLHMRQAEGDIWTAFLRSTELDFTRVAYDLHLGQGQPVYDYDNEVTRQMKLAVTRKRMDALGETAEDIWIFEIKERLGVGALGQLLAYGDLYDKEYNPSKPVRLAAIARAFQPDIEETYSLYGISIFIV